jgi:hypothetical protein
MRVDAAWVLGETLKRTKLREPAAYPLQVRPPEWFRDEQYRLFGHVHVMFNRMVSKGGRYVTWTASAKVA